MEVFLNFLTHWEGASVATQRGIIALFLSPFVVILLMGTVEKIWKKIEGRRCKR